MKLLASIIAVIILAALALVAPRGTGAQSGKGQSPQRRPTPMQTPQEVGDEDVIRVDTELVTLVATVTDARGRYVAKRGYYAPREEGATPVR